MNNGNNYQLTTRNPQSNGGSVLQPNNQVSGVNQSSGLNPQILPKTNSLQVTQPTNVARLSTSTQANSQAPASVMNSTPLWVFSIVTAVLAVGLLLLAKIAKPASETNVTSKVTPPPALDHIEVIRPKVKKKKSTAKKRTAKKQVRRRK